MPQKIVTFTPATAPELEKEAYWIARLKSGVMIYYFDQNKKEIGYSTEGIPNFGIRTTRDWDEAFLDKLIWTRIHKSAE